ncbi:MAG: hypothetical protein AAFR87_28065 [Bacteroidota bacterium]
MKKAWVHIAFWVIFLTIWSCERQVAIGPFDPAPILHQISLSQDSLIEFQDSLFLYLDYEDANGDLGYSLPDQKSLWIKDSRLEEADWYHVPPLAPEGIEVHIQGRFRIDLGSPFMLSNDELEEIVYKVKLQDRAGNWSEEISSDTLVLRR